MQQLLPTNETVTEVIAQFGNSTFAKRGWYPTDTFDHNKKVIQLPSHRLRSEPAYYYVDENDYPFYDKDTHPIGVIGSGTSVHVCYAYPIELNAKTGTYEILLHRPCAVKVFKAPDTHSGETVDSQNNEVIKSIKKQPSHIKVHGAHRIYNTPNKKDGDSNLYLFTELAGKRDLYAAVEQGKFNFNLVERTRRAIIFLRDLQWLSFDSVHRDIKSKNVMDNGRVIDHEMRKKTDKNNPNGYIKDKPLGTPHNISPEVLQGKYSKKTDAYAAAEVLAKMFGEENPYEDKNKVVKGKPIKDWSAREWYDFVRTAFTLTGLYSNITSPGLDETKKTQLKNLTRMLISDLCSKTPKYRRGLDEALEFFETKYQYVLLRQKYNPEPHSARVSQIIIRDTFLKPERISLEKNTAQFYKQGDATYCYINYGDETGAEAFKLSEEEKNLSQEVFVRKKLLEHNRRYFSIHLENPPEENDYSDEKAAYFYQKDGKRFCTIVYGDNSNNELVEYTGEDTQEARQKFINEKIEQHIAKQENQYLAKMILIAQGCWYDRVSIRDLGPCKKGGTRFIPVGFQYFDWDSNPVFCKAVVDSYNGKAQGVVKVPSSETLQFYKQVDGKNSKHFAFNAVMKLFNDKVLGKKEAGELFCQNSDNLDDEKLGKTNALVEVCQKNKIKITKSMYEKALALDEKDTKDIAKTPNFLYALEKNDREPVIAGLADNSPSELYSLLVHMTEMSREQSKRKQISDIVMHNELINQISKKLLMHNGAEFYTQKEATSKTYTSKLAEAVYWVSGWLFNFSEGGLLGFSISAKKEAAQLLENILKEPKDAWQFFSNDNKHLRAALKDSQLGRASRKIVNMLEDNTFWSTLSFLNYLSTQTIDKDQMKKWKGHRLFDFKRLFLFLHANAEEVKNVLSDSGCKQLKDDMSELLFGELKTYRNDKDGLWKQSNQQKQDFYTGSPWGKSWQQKNAALNALEKAYTDPKTITDFFKDKDNHLASLTQGELGEKAEDLLEGLRLAAPQV